MAKRKGNLLGSWAFLIGVVLAVILGFLGTIDQTMTVVLVVIGLIVGLFNIADEEADQFLLAGAVLIIASAFGSTAVQAVPVFNSILGALLLIFVPATVIVAIKHVFALAKN